jgi:cytochrome P450 / NADPH-cytochrome P450 reductase
MLSYTFYLLLKHPEVLKKLREEVDGVLGFQYPTIHDIPKLQYLDQVLKESIRLHPTAPVCRPPSFD